MKPPKQVSSYTEGVGIVVRVNEYGIDIFSMPISGGRKKLKRMVPVLLTIFDVKLEKSTKYQKQPLVW